MFIIRYKDRKEPPVLCNEIPEKCYEIRNYYKIARSILVFVSKIHCICCMRETNRKGPSECTLTAWQPYDMKIILIFLILAIGFQNTYTQTNNYLTTEVGVDYYYYFLEESHSYKFSYGSSILFSNNINRLMIASGLSYANKSYTSPGSDFHNSDLHEHTLKYLNFPIIAGVEILSYEKLMINLSSSFYYKTMPDSNNYSPDYKNIPEDKFAIGIRLGIEYIFKTL